MKENKKKFTGGWLPNLVKRPGWLKWLLCASLLAGLATNIARAQNSFANAQVLDGGAGTGSVTNDNSSVTPDLNAPNIAGMHPRATLWYQWTPQASGDVELDTIGSSDDPSGLPLDTVLAVFTGTSLASLNQVAANDDLFPIYRNNALYTTGLHPTMQINDAGSSDYSQYAATFGALFYGVIPVFTYPQNQFIYAYYGPSHLHFNASAGTVYYIAVDSKAPPTVGQPSPPVLTGLGPIVLNWAFQSSGVFRFASEDQDWWTGLPIYQAAQTESLPSGGYANDANSTFLTYYQYNQPGVLVTVTRTAGSSGRAWVDYQTVDGTVLGGLVSPNDWPAVSNVDYVPVSGTLVFDDYEMSKTILVPMSTNWSQSTFQSNAVFAVQLSNPRLDPAQPPAVSTPRVDPYYGLSLIRILNVNADPYGPDYVITGIDTNPIPPVTNYGIARWPTNVIINFQKAHYCVPEDVNDSANGISWAKVVIYAERFGTNGASLTLNYRVNNYMNDDADANEEMNNRFPLQPGSDYAVPTPATISPVQGLNSDFDLAKGTITFPSSGNGKFYQPISFTVTNSTGTKFNKDFKISLYREVSSGGQNVAALAGLVAETTVTILFNDRHPPAGSVDEMYNADFNRSLAVPFSQIPKTQPDKNNYPGVAGLVNSLLVLTNNEMFIAGDFNSYNGHGYTNANQIETSINDIALIDTNGNLDYSFKPSSGADGPIHALVAGPGNQFIIGGEFLSFNGQDAHHIARLNANGSLDGTFSGDVDGTVRAVAVQPDGGILLGGDFNTVDGQTRNYMARLNANGSLDATFDPGTTLTGPVQVIALQPRLNIQNSSQGGSNEVDQAINLGQATAATLTVNYDMQNIADDMRIFYGDTNVTAGTGVLIYDTGSISGTGTIVLPFGPVNGLTTNLITIVMDQGGGTVGTYWSYDATIDFGLSGIMVGGDFDVSGQSFSRIARLTSSGALDTAFNPLSGADNSVLTLGWQSDGKVVVGGAFSLFNGQVNNHIARINADGSLDNGFFSGSGANDEVRSICLQPDGTMYVGGLFSLFNGTHRLGFTRLYGDGTVDTTFLDTAYNQFAGLKRIFSDDTPAVYACGVQSDGNVMIGGTFDAVGGGQVSTNVFFNLDNDHSATLSFADTNLWVEPKSRDGVRIRHSVARLIGGATPGPGNIGLLSTTSSANKSGSSTSVGLSRYNGYLGPIAANFSVLPGSAQSGADYSYNSPPPLFWEAWNYISTPTRTHSDGLFGISGGLQDIFNGLPQTDSTINNQSAVTVSVINNRQTSGDVNALFQLANPSGADEFYLGGQNIPLGAALGISGAKFNVIDDNKQSGASGFAYTNYVTTGLLNTIGMVRSNGSYGDITMRCYATNGTAVQNVDYKPITNLSIRIQSGKTTNFFTFTNLNSGLSSTNFVEKNVNLHLLSLTGPVDGNPTFGISNSVVRLINANFAGYLTLSAGSYTGNESAGSITFTVNRVAGNSGTLYVQYATTNGTALNGQDYIGATNTLKWDSGDASARIVTIQLTNNGVVGANKSFVVNLRNPTNGVLAAPGLFYNANSPGSVTNATLTIVNDNSYGTLQFSAPSYLASENGGYATITVLRTGGIAGPISTHFATSNGSNTVAGVNYLATNGVLVFAVNQMAASFNVRLLDDLLTDPTNFYFNVNLSKPTNAVLGSLTNAVVNILDWEGHSGQVPGSPDQPFTTAINGEVLALALQPNGQILAGGNFSSVNGAPFNGIARLNPDGSPDSTGFLNGYDGAKGPVQSVVCQTDGSVVIGGAFNTVDLVSRKNIARLKTDGSLDTSFNPGPGADAPVYAVAEAFVNGTRRIYVGGAFTSISGQTSPNFTRLYGQNIGGTVAGSPDPFFTTGSGPNNTVYAIAVYPTNSLLSGKVLIGGAFTNVNGFTLNHVARLNVDGTVDTSFGLNLGTDGSVRVIALQADGSILIGGDFSNHVARLNSDGSLDTAFLGNADNSVTAIGIQADNRIVLGGQFAHANGVTRNNLTRLLPTGAPDLNINFGDGANGAVDAVLIQPGDQRIVIGGAFTEYNDQPHAHIARIYGGSMTGSGAIQFTSSDFQVDERSGQTLITVSRTGGTSGPNADGTGNILVNFATSNHSALAGTNYIPVATTLSFPPGEVLESVPVQVMDDLVVTPDLTVNMTLSNITPPATNGIYPTATLHIINDDSAVSFSNANYSVAKNVSSGFQTIDVLRAGTNGICSVDFLTTANGTAVAGQDFIAINTNLTFNPGEVIKHVQVPIINNPQPYGYRTVQFILTNAVNTVLSSPSNATLTIIDTANAHGEFSFASTNFDVNEGDGTAYIAIVRTNGTVGDVTLTCLIVPGTPPGAALPGVNYDIPTITTVTFHDQVAVQYFQIPLKDNTQVQGTVHLSVILTNPPPGAILIDPTNTTLNIADNDNGFVFTKATNYFRENLGSVPVSVERVGPGTNLGVSVSFYTTNDTTSGSAIAGVNYTPISGTLPFAPGETLKTIFLPLIYDPLVTGDLSFLIKLYNPTNGTQLGSVSNSVIVVQDADAGLHFTTNASSVFKSANSAQNAHITVICSNPDVEPLTTNVAPLSVNFATVDGTAIAGVDYAATNGTLLFTNKLGTNTFDVSILPSTLINGNHDFTVTLSQPTFPGQLVWPSTQTVTIIDNNSGLSFSKPAYTVFRSDVSATITVLRTDNLNTNTFVDFATADGTGVDGIDYKGVSGTLVFTNGVTSQTFSVTVYSSATVQPDKTVLLQLSNPQSGTLVAPYNATLTIQDNSGSDVIPAGATFTATGDPNHNGLIDSNETVTLWFGWRAAGGTNVSDLKATLLSLNGITSPSPAGAQDYGPLTVLGPSVSRAFTFTVDPAYTNSQQILASFQLLDGTKNIGTNGFTFTIGAWTSIYSNAAPIVINDNTMASPYPSTISVSGAGGVVYKATVTLTNFNHTSPGDVDVLLVAPNQQNTLIMAHVGAQNVAKKLTLTFDDDSTTTLSRTNALVSGTNKPSAYLPVGNFP